MSLPSISSIVDGERHDKSEKFIQTTQDSSLEETYTTTKMFVEDCLAKGLPIIPFQYPSTDVLENISTNVRNRDIIQKENYLTWQMT